MRADIWGLGVIGRFYEPGLDSHHVKVSQTTALRFCSTE